MFSARRILAAQVVGREHDLERAQDRTRGIGQEGGDPGQGLFLLGVEHVQDGTGQQGVGRLVPMITQLLGTFRIDQDIGDVLDVADFPFAAADLEQRVVGRRLGVGRIENQHAAVPRAESGGEPCRLIPLLPKCRVFFERWTGLFAKD